MVRGLRLQPEHAASTPGETRVAAAREVRSFDYVNYPYERVRAALTADAPAVFRAATAAASSRARSVASALRVSVAGLEVAKEIAIAVHGIDEQPATVTAPPSTRVHLEWEAASAPALFPLMKADLLVYPLTATETQLDLSGRYEPPLGWLGSALNAAVGHRIAEASVHRFVSEVADHLRTTLR
jgi:hypothetical protein